MLSLERYKAALTSTSTFKDISDEDAEKMRDAHYKLANLALQEWLKKKGIKPVIHDGEQAPPTNGEPPLAMMIVLW